MVYAQLSPVLFVGDLNGMGQDGVLEIMAELMLRRVLQAYHHAHPPEIGRGHVAEAGDGELTGENLNGSSSEKRHQ